METKNELIVCKKVSFADEKQALFYIEKLNKTSNRKSVPQRTYLCHKCSNWHLTSQVQIKTYSVLLAECESLKQDIIEKNKEIKALKESLEYERSKELTDKDKIIKERGEKISQQNSTITKLESIVKKKDKVFNSIAKLIIDNVK